MGYEHTFSACERILALKGSEGDDVTGQFRDEMGSALLNLARAIEADLSRISRDLAELRKASATK